MRIEEILHRQFTDDLLGIHLARVRVVFAAACALLRAGRMSLTSIGRAIATGTTHKHGIKRMDRLLGNENIAAERSLFFRAIARRVIAAGSRPVVIVDWTSFNSEMWSLVAAVSFEGRAVIIYSETHPVARYNKPAVNRQFLRQLRQVLPDQCVPIIVTDAGFRTPWMREVTRLGWDYICRLRGLNSLRQTGTRPWWSLSTLFGRVLRRPKDLGQFEIGIRVRHQARVIGFRKGRRTKCRERWGTMPRNALNKQLRSAREPWILATSLDSSPQKVVALYRLRMQIEETFRDAKCTRFGLSMNQARTTSEHRADILMLLASLAHLLSLVVGLVAEAFKLDRGYQANTFRKRRVFSLSRLGRLVITGNDVQHVNYMSVSAAWLFLLERAGTP